MNKAKQQLADELSAAFANYEDAAGPLPAFTVARRMSLVGQLVDSIRRNLYIEHLRVADLSINATDPANVSAFDPIKAAIIHHREGDEDEAFWMIFLLTHFGRNRQAGWRYVRDVYGALGSNRFWTWERIVGNIDAFRDWLDEHRAELQDASRPRGFGNHRKYESLAGWTAAGTGSVVASYRAWVGEPPQHRLRIAEVIAPAANDPEQAFELFFRSLDAVHRFGRTARFDYLSMVDKTGLAQISPGRAYLQGATGPLRGARLLFCPTGPRLTVPELEDRAALLQRYLGVSFDVLEDALCNWQKSPTTFKPFRG